MSGASWTARLEDAVGPIVVKEVRQGLRARVFAIFFGLLLTGCLVAAIVAVARAADAAGGQLGKEFLATYLIALGVVCYFVIPFIAFRSLLREREDETWVLLVLTGLGARHIVRGKFTSALSQALLFASACAPFVVFSYYLNGVDLLQIVLALVLSAGWTTLLVAVALGVATLAHSRLGRAAANFLVLALLAAATGMALVFSAYLADEGGRFVTEPSFLAFCAGVVLLGVGGAAVVLEAAASALALATEAVSRGPRVALVLFLAAIWVFGAVGASVGKAEPEAALIGSIATSLLLLAAGLFATSEQDGWTKVNRHHGWLRPGALRSYLLVLSLLAASTLVWVAIYFGLTDAHSEGRLRALLAAPLYVLLYLSAGVFFGRATPLARLGEPIATRVGFFVATTLGVVVPPVAALLAGHRGSYRSANHLNPLVGMVNFIDGRWEVEGRIGLVLLSAVCLLSAFVAWTVLATRDRERTS